VILACALILRSAEDHSTIRGEEVSSLTARGERVRPAVDAGPACMLLIELCRAGWPDAEIAAAAGISRRCLRQIPRRWLISARLADRLVCAHLDLMDCEPPPPYGDPAAVERLLAGEPPARYTRRERREAVRRLRVLGLSKIAIARRIRAHVSSVRRDIVVLSRAGEL